MSSNFGLKPSEAALRMREERPSGQIKKRYCENREPWQTPWLGIICPTTEPLMLKEQVIVEIQSEMIRRQQSEKPSFHSMVSMKDQSTQSKALLMSSFKL